MLISPEKKQDIPAIRRLNEIAFGQKGEADLVDALRDHGAITLSLVALEDERIVGHILFSPVTIEQEGSEVKAVGLGPMAVLPEHQNSGIGSGLVRYGIDELKKQGVDLVVVVGHPAFYPRFGFVPASRYSLQCEYDVPDDVFMARIINDTAADTLRGMVHYREEFSQCV
jgi:putative acetyltransferase